MTDAVYRFLTKPRRIRSAIRKTEAEIEGLRLSMLPGAINYDKDSVQSSPEDPMVKFGVKICELEEQKTRLQNEYLEAQEEVVAVAGSLEELESLVITLRFISDVDFDGIADEIGKSRRQMFRYYDRALKNLENVIK